MYTLIKVLAALMLISFGSTAMAWVDCSGLPGYIGYGKPNIKSECKEFQLYYGATGINWRSEDGRYSREAGVDYRNGGNSSANSKTSGASQSIKTMVVKKKSGGQILSEHFNFYVVIEKYGMKDGLEKIENFWQSRSYPKNNFVKIEKYLTNISWKKIQEEAQKFSINVKVKKFLAKKDTTLASK